MRPLPWTDSRPPDRFTLRRWLERAVSLGLLRRDGQGIRNHPYRYWRPEQEEVWRQDPLGPFFVPELFDQAPPSPAPPDARPG